MSRRIALGTVAAVALAGSLVTMPAYAATEFPITVSPDEARPGETLTVSGDATDPTCAEDGVAVRFHYTKPDGSEATVVSTTTTDAAGHFETTVTIPENAVAGEPSHVVAVIADCTPPGGETSSRSSESEQVEVLAHEGEFTISRKSGRPGDILAFAGTNCYGDAVVVFFGPEEYDGEPQADKTFAGEIEVPELPDGTYEVGAACPGTDYRVYSFRLVNPQDTSPAPPARPVPGRPTFTG